MIAPFFPPPAFFLFAHLHAVDQEYVELLDNDGAFLLDNDGTQLADND